MKTQKKPNLTTNDSNNTDEIIRKSKKRTEALKHFIRAIKKIDYGTTKIFLTLFSLLVIAISGIAQGITISDDETYTTSSTNSLLEIFSKNNDKGILIPRLSSTERIAITLNSANDKGLLVYDIDKKSFWYYNGTAWAQVGSTIDCITDFDGDTEIQLEQTSDDDNIRFSVAGNEAMIIDENSKVGIGTNNPGSKLEIAKVSTSADEDALKIGVDGENWASIKFYDDDAEDTQHFKMSFSAQNQDFKFHSDQTGNILVLTNDGKIGSGITQPEKSKLHLYGTGSFDGIIRMNNDGDAGHEYYIGPTNNNWTVAKGNFVLGSGVPGESTVEMVMTRYGNIGIGVTEPTNKLEVAGNVKIGQYVLPSIDGYNGQVLKTNGSGTLGWENDNNINTHTWSVSGDNVYRDIGSVGIGTSSPSGILDVSYNTAFTNEVIDQQQTDYIVGELFDALWWQSFTAGMNGYLSKISLYYSSPTTGSIYLKIYDGQGTGGTLLGVTNSTTFSGGSYGWANFVVVDDISLVSGNEYTFAMEFDAGESWSGVYEEGDVYSGGVMYHRGYISTDYDYAFSTYVADSYTQPGKLVVLGSGDMGFGTEVSGNIEGIKLQTEYESGQTSSRLFFSEDNEQEWGFSWIYAGQSNPTFGNTTFTLPSNTLHLVRHHGSTSGDIAMSIHRNTGYIGIGTSSPNYLLEVAGDAAKPGGGMWSGSSDRRLKDIRNKYLKGLNEILELNPVEYSYKKDNHRHLPDTIVYQGFVAQDVQKAFPEAVTTGNDGYLDLNLQSVNVAIVNSIKELNKANLHLEQKNNELEIRIQNLESLILQLSNKQNNENIAAR